MLGWEGRSCIPIRTTVHAPHASMACVPCDAGGRFGGRTMCWLPLPPPPMDAHSAGHPLLRSQCSHRPPPPPAHTTNCTTHTGQQRASERACTHASHRCAFQSPHRARTCPLRSISAFLSFFIAMTLPDARSRTMRTCARTHAACSMDGGHLDGQAHAATAPTWRFHCDLSR